MRKKKIIMKKIKISLRKKMKKFKIMKKILKNYQN